MELGNATGRIEIAFDGSGVSAAQKALADLEGQGKSLAGTMSSAGLVLAGVGAGLTAPFAGAVKVAADFESQLAAIASVGGAEAVARMDELKAAALEMGAETSFSASEAAAGIEELVKAGLPVQDVLDGAAEAALNLAAATGTSVPQSAEIMSTALNVFGESLTQFNTAGEKAVYIADTLAQAANASATDVLTLGQGLSQVGSVAAQFGIGIDQTTEALALMANAGIQGSDAGTSLKTMLLSLLDPTAKQAKAMAELGLSYDQFYQDGQFIGLADSAEMLKGALSDLTQEQQQTALAVIFGSDAIRAATVLTDEGAAGFRQMAEDMDGAGTTSEQAAQRLDTFMGSLMTLQGSIETLAITLGDQLIPVVQPVVEKITELVNGLIGASDETKKWVAILGGGVGVLTAFAGASLLVASKVLEGVKAMQELAKATQALTIGRSSIGALTGLLGPWGLAITGVTFILGGLVKEQLDSAAAARDQADAINQFGDAVNDVKDIAARGVFRDLLSGLDPQTEVVGPLGDMVQSIEADYDRLLESGQMTVDMLADYALGTEGATKVTLAFGEAASSAGDDSIRAAKSAGILDAAHRKGTLGGKEYVSMAEAMAEALAYQGDGAEYVRGRMFQLIEQFGRDGNVRKFTSQMNALTKDEGGYADIILRAKKATEDHNATLGDAEKAIIVTGAALGGYVDALNEATKAEKEAAAASRAYRQELRNEARDIVNAADEAAQKAGDQQRKATDQRIAEAERGAKGEIAAIDRSGKEQVRIAQRTGDALIAAAEATEQDRVAAAERVANAEIRAAQQAEREKVAAAESASRDAIRARRLEETQTVNAAERVADAQIQAARDAEEAVVDAAQTQADGQIAAAERAEQETVRAAERAATQQVRVIDSATKASIRSIEAQVNAATRAADQAYNRAAAAIDRTEQAAIDAAQREYDMRVEMYTDVADKDYEARANAADRAYDKETKNLEKRYGDKRAEKLTEDAEKRRSKIIDKAEEERRDKIAAAEEEYQRAKEAAEAKARKQAEIALRLAERKANQIKREAQREATKKEREILREAEQQKRGITKQTEQLARDEAAKTQAAREVAEAAVAAAKEAAAQEAADTIATIERGLELTRRKEAHKTAVIERQQNKLLNKATRDAERETAETLNQINQRLEEQKQRYANQTERVRTQVAKNTRDIERETASQIREINRRLIEDRRTQEQNFTDFLRKQAEQRRRIAEGARKDAQAGIDPGSAAATRQSARDARRENLDGPVPAASGIAGWFAAGAAAASGMAASDRTGRRSDGVLQTVMAQQGEFLRSLMSANAAAISAAMPKTLEATVVIDGAGFKQVVLGTALAPLGAAAERVGRRREAWG